MKNSDSHNLLNILFLNNISGLGPKTILNLLSKLETIENILDQNANDLLNMGISRKIVNQIIGKDFTSAEKQLKMAEIYNVDLISIDSPIYPEQLKNIYDPPLVLYVQGNTDILRKSQIAVVGSRSATSCGIKAADYFAYNLAKEQMVITSGLAKGVDYYAHKAAIRAGDFTTVGVMGTSIDKIYPKEHSKLVSDILNNNGCILSELPFSTPPKAQNFPRRNRIISGLSKGVLVVEAKERSGSLVTARMALEQNREVFAVPGSIFNKEALGTNILLQNGAKLVLSVDDILEEVDIQKNISYQKKLFDEPKILNTEKLKKLDDDSLAILEILNTKHASESVISYDDIVSNANINSTQLSVLLMNLEIEGLINKVPGGYLKVG